MDSILAIFDFIYSIFDTIIQGIYGCIELVTSIVNLIINITKIIPSPMYQCLLAFLSLFIVIFSYKIFRKG